jgi:hypothetical protein
MKKFSIIIILLLPAVLLIFCQSAPVIKIEIKETEDGFVLYREGEPYFIKGAGIESHYDKLAESGGNSIRVWGIDQWEEAFQMAEKYGLTVCAGIWLEQERRGFDYDDKEAVEAQFNSVKSAILKYKDHPALLMWGVGNELDLMFENPKVWDAVEQVAAYINEVDGNHPIMTATAFIREDVVDLIKSRSPSVDILGINVYAGLPRVAELVREFGWDKPYILSEWGTIGHWEVPLTSWDEPIELTSREKAHVYRTGYEAHILTDPACLGGYVFLWGAKQERTPTWYSMFLPTGEKTESVDALYQLWQGDEPGNKSPILDSLRINARCAYSNIILKPSSENVARVWVAYPENDDLTITWKILHETTDKGAGGDKEEKPAEVKGLNNKQVQDILFFQAPEKEGPYRLFTYIYDKQGGGAHANIPFFVSK